MTGSSGSGAYKGGVAVALVTSFLTVWTTIVRDDGSGMSFFFLIMAAIVGGFAARFSAAGMARTMLGVAVMQALLAIAIVTAPVTANIPDGVLKAWLFGSAFTLLWLLSAVLFRVASTTDDQPPIAR